MKHVGWTKGGEARIVSIEGDRIRLASTTPAAPGTPLAGVLDNGLQIRIKVARCRREDASFVIEGRLVDASRDVRQALLSLLVAPGEASS